MGERKGWLRKNGIRVCSIACLIVALSLSFLPHVQGVAQGDGMMVYGEGTVATPRYRTLSGSTWSAESSLPTAAASIRQIITRASPTRNELMTGVINSSGTLTVYRWDGASWTSQWTATPGLGNVTRFDIAYEQSSGKAMVLYSRNAATTNELVHRIWDGNSWTAATNLDAVRTSGIVQYVRLAARPGTDELAAAWGDASFDLSANYFDGANAVWKGEPAAALDTVLATTSGASTISSRNFDLAFEQNSGDLLVVWGNDNDTFPHYATRASGVNGAWGSPTSGGTSFKIQGLDIQLASEPGTDYIAYANMGGWNGASGNYAEAAMWTGSAWANFNNYDNTTSTVDVSLVRTSVEWVKSGTQSRAVVVYDDSASTGVDWLYFNKNTNAWSAVQTDYTGAPAPSSSGAAGAMWLQRNPFNAAEVTYVTVDGAIDLYTKKISFDGTNLTWSSTEPSGTSPEANIAAKLGWAVSFAYNQYVPPPGTLSVDVVDSGGVTVPSPSLTLSSISASDACQTSTGTLGTASQKIRINNGTATPGWSLSIAATNGATGNWSATGASYDFNDGSGSPAGCGDGADADSIAGQLSVNPSVGTIAAQSGCTTTGLSKGSSNAFAQGTTDNITLLTASGSAGTSCYWDFTGVTLSQTVPSLQAAGAYSIPMTITVVAN